LRVACFGALGVPGCFPERKRRPRVRKAADG